MALMKRKESIGKLVNKRDKAYDRLKFNRDYPEVAAVLIDQKNNQAIRKQELKSKKKLLPLEMATLSEADRNEVLFEREMRRLREKQVMPRRAIRQAYLRALEVCGEAEAAKARDAKLTELDKKLEAKAASLKKKYSGASTAAAPHDAVARYEKLLKEEEARMALLIEQQRAEKKKKLDALHMKLNAQSEKLRVEFDAANRRIHSLSKVDPEAFGERNILCIRSLRMYFSGIKAVDDISFNVKQGEIFGLIGPNGAGKTTLFNCITQFYKPTGGSVYYRDRFGNLVDLGDYSASDVIRAGIARTFQNIELVYTLSVLDNLLVGAHSQYGSGLFDQFAHTGKLKSEEEVFARHAAELLERLGILEYKDMFPFGLPYGVLKKVELARTLMSAPRLIILDEPAAGLNEAETEDLANIIRLIRNDLNCTILLVEHDMNFVMSLCDTVCATSFGKMLAIGTPDDIQNSPLVQEAYLGTE